MPNSSSHETVAVVGLGYVGLPLAIAAAESGRSVVGIERDMSKISLLNSGISYIEDISNSQLRQSLENGSLRVTSDKKSVGSASTVVLCVPTPISENKPDLTILRDAVEQIAPHIAPGTLIVSESSSFPGTLREVIIPLFQRHSLSPDLLFAHAPERVDPGNRKWNIQNTPRLVAGTSSLATSKTKQFYELFCNSVIVVDSPEIAEAAKMFENTFRQVNIALANEFARYCSKIGLDARAVLDAANTKPYGFMKFFHGPGVGGHCIPVDPYYLTYHARMSGSVLRLVELANQVNEEQPTHVIEKVKEILQSKLENSKILVIGLGYKPGTKDWRQSPGIKIFSLLKNICREVYWFDPRIEQLEDLKRDETGNSYDLIVQVQTEEDFEYRSFHERSKLVLDCTGKLGKSSKVIQL